MIFRRTQTAASADRGLYDALVARARLPVFYRDFAVPDTIDGRFDLLALHAYLVLAALNDQGEQGTGLGTELVSLVFAGFDGALRSLGVSDFGLSRRIKAMADAFYGRLEAYRAAASEAGMAAALVRNLYRGDDSKSREAAALARYVYSVQRGFREGGARLLKGELEFGPLPEL